MLTTFALSNEIQTEKTNFENENKGKIINNF
jgi:hypothetical protein